MWSLQNGFWGYGSNLENIKFLFPTATYEGPSDGEWYETYFAQEGSNSNCDFTFTSECAYNLDSIDTAGQEIAWLITNEIDNNGIEPENIYLGGISMGGRLVWHTAFA